MAAETADLLPVANGEEIMSTQTTRTAGDDATSRNDPTAKEHQPTTCDSNTCSTGVCSPCIIVWGLVALYLIVTALLEYFR